jgi:hypothetical protein
MDAQAGWAQAQGQLVLDGVAETNRKLDQIVDKLGDTHDVVNTIKELLLNPKKVPQQPITNKPEDNKPEEEVLQNNEEHQKHIARIKELEKQIEILQLSPDKQPITQQPITQQPPQPPQQQRIPITRQESQEIPPAVPHTTCTTPRKTGPCKVGDRVEIFGLRTERGLKLNGLVGTIVADKNERWTVDIFGLQLGEDTRPEEFQKSILKVNIKHAVPLPFAVGDLVKHERRGVGKIHEVGEDNVIVHYDNGDSRSNSMDGARASLTKLSSEQAEALKAEALKAAAAKPTPPTPKSEEHGIRPSYFQTEAEISAAVPGLWLSDTNNILVGPSPKPRRFHVQFPSGITGEIAFAETCTFTNEGGTKWVLQLNKSDATKLVWGPVEPDKNTIAWHKVQPHVPCFCGKLLHLSKEKHNPRYDKLAWRCDGCGKSGEDDRYFHRECDVDFCKECGAKAAWEAKNPPRVGDTTELKGLNTARLNGKRGKVVSVFDDFLHVDMGPRDARGEPTLKKIKKGNCKKVPSMFVVKPGDRVTLVGFTGSYEKYNGEKGTIKGPDTDDDGKSEGLWLVALDRNTISCTPNKFKKDTQPARHPAPASSRARSNYPTSGPSNPSKGKVTTIFEMVGEMMTGQEDFVMINRGMAALEVKRIDEKQLGVRFQFGNVGIITQGKDEDHPMVMHVYDGDMDLVGIFKLDLQRSNKSQWIWTSTVPGRGPQVWARPDRMDPNEMLMRMFTSEMFMGM